jgi:META domain
MRGILAATALAVLAAAAHAQAPSGAPTLDELRQATYSGFDKPAGPVTLRDGRWQDQPSRRTITLAPGFRVTGDLDGDGADEAVVLLSYNSGGSGTFDYVAVARRTAKGVANVATAPVGDHVQIRSARIEGGKLMLSVVRPGPDDARCCAGELADLGWTLLAGKLNSDAARVTGRLSLDVLAGVQWVLRGWSEREAAPQAPLVTLVYQNGRLAGTSGCNRYTASVKAGDPPGEYSVGPIAGTQMACPAPQAAVETRFLKSLAASRKVTFWLGRLGLLYQLPGTPPRLLLFERQPLETGPPR